MTEEFITPSNIYRLWLPNGYSFEENHDVINVYNEKRGYGAISITCYNIPSDYVFDLTDEIVDFAKTIDASVALKIINIFKNRIFASFISEKKYWLIFLNFEYNKAVFASYNCNVEDESFEKNDVSKILSSIEILPPK